MIYPHPWVSPDATVAIATTLFIAAIYCFAHAIWYQLVGVSPLVGVSYPQFMKTREQLQREIAAQSAEIASLHMLNSELEATLTAAMSRRHLTKVQKDTIDRIAANRTNEAMQSWPPEEDRGSRFHIALCAVGSDTETFDYRQDFEEAFGRSFEIHLEDWQASSQLVRFRNAVSVVDPTDRRNIVHPWILEALRAANIENLQEQSRDFPPSPTITRHEPQSWPRWLADSPAVWVVIGQR